MAHHRLDLVDQLGEGARPAIHVIPMNYGREGERLLLHGSAASRLMRGLEAGWPVCLTVTLLDGLVLARSAFHHSMNFRSVVLFGRARPVEDPAGKTAALSLELIPGEPVPDGAEGPAEVPLHVLAWPRGR